VLLGVDAILDMARTSVNVLGQLFGGRCHHALGGYRSAAIQPGLTCGKLLILIDI